MACAVRIGIFLVLLFSIEASAASGDTNIFVSYKIDTTRLRPSPVSGVGEVSLRAVLHSDGTVDDVVEAKGGKNTKQWQLNDRKLGGQKDFKPQWRVIDENTLERKSSERTYDLIVRVIVKGKNCKADVAYALHPGQKEYVVYSTQLDQIAYYSKLKPFALKCKID